MTIKEFKPFVFKDGRGSCGNNPLASPGVILMVHCKTNKHFLFSSKNVNRRITSIRYAINYNIEKRIPNEAMACLQQDSAFDFYYKLTRDADRAKGLLEELKLEFRHDERFYNRRKAVKAWYQTEEGRESVETRGRGRGRKVNIKGSVYTSIRSACRTLRIPVSTMMVYLKDETNHDFTYL